MKETDLNEEDKMIIAHTEALIASQGHESLNDRKEHNFNPSALFRWEKIYFDQVHGQNTITLNKEKTYFFNDPSCNDCGDVPFFAEGEWHKTVQ